MTIRKKTLTEALQAVADLPTVSNEDVMEGQEQAYRAIEALVNTSPALDEVHTRLKNLVEWTLKNCPNAMYIPVPTDIANSISEELLNLQKRREDLEDVVVAARDVFVHYAELHAAKPDMAKAERNYNLAKIMNDAIGSDSPKYQSSEVFVNKT